MYAQINLVGEKKHKSRIKKIFGGTEGRQVGVGLNLQSNGSFNAYFQIDNQPVFNLYQYQAPRRIPEPAQPAVFDKNHDINVKNETTTQNSKPQDPLPPIVLNPAAYATPSQFLARNQDEFEVTQPGGLPSVYLFSEPNQKQPEKSTEPSNAKAPNNTQVASKNVLTSKKPENQKVPEPKSTNNSGKKDANTTPLIFSDKGKQTVNPSIKTESKNNTLTQFGIGKEKTDKFLSTCGGKSGTLTNACINNVYYFAGKDMRNVLWPTAAVAGSVLVGRNIELAETADAFTVKSFEGIHELATGLPMGNQLIATDIIPLLKIYKNEGFAGIKNLKTYLEEHYASSAKKLINAFEQQDILDKRADVIAKALAVDRNNLKVIHQLFANPENVKLAFNSSMSLVFHEQIIVQEMYNSKLTSELKNPLNVAIGSFLGLDSVHINGKKFSYSNYVKDPSNFNQRMHYFEAIFKEIVKVYQDPKKLDQYFKQIDDGLAFRNISVASLQQTTGNDLVSFPQKMLDVRFIQKMKSDAYIFWHSSNIPETQSKKCAKMN